MTFGKVWVAGTSNREVPTLVVTIPMEERKARNIEQGDIIKFEIEEIVKEKTRKKRIRKQTKKEKLLQIPKTNEKPEIEIEPRT